MALPSLQKLWTSSCDIVSLTLIKHQDGSPFSAKVMDIVLWLCVPDTNQTSRWLSLLCKSYRHSLVALCPQQVIKHQEGSPFSLCKSYAGHRLTGNQTSRWLSFLCRHYGWHCVPNTNQTSRWLSFLCKRYGWHCVSNTNQTSRWLSFLCKRYGHHLVSDWLCVSYSRYTKVIDTVLIVTLWPPT